ncbi:reverse transcriptase domain-containing protein [Tanacetum coccineum]
MSLELADRSIQYPRGIIENVLIQVDKFILPIDFVILDMPEDSRKSINQSDLESCESLGNKPDDDFDQEKPIRRIDYFNTPYPVAQETAKPNGVKSEHLYSASANEINVKKPKLKNLPHHLEYAYLHGDKSFPIIISSELFEKEKMLLLQVFEKRKGAIAWKMSNIKGIRPLFCTHKILMEDDFKPVIQPQRRLNPKVQDVVKNKIVKLLDSELIYSISDSSWVSPIHVVPKKGGMTIVLNDDNELIPSRIITGWRVCIDYRKHNDATQKDHFPLPFIDQMLERLCGNEYYCFLDGFSGFFQIPITPEDQEKTMFTFPYVTFAYRRMSFGLCNPPVTFQRCMTTIFHDMVEDFMEVFMDDFSVFDNSFNCCLANLDRMLARCEETNLMLNWEKCLFMVKEGIVLGHKISGARIEVDIAKIKKLPYPTNVKGVRSFLGHSGFYCSNFAVEVVLGQRIDGKFKPIYYASKTLNNAQEHYTTTEKELLVVVSSFDKFRPYLILSKTIVYTDHSALKYLFRAENLATYHLSRLENPDLGAFIEEEIADEFPDEHLMILISELNDDESYQLERRQRLPTFEEFHLESKGDHALLTFNIMNDVDIEDLTIEQYLRLTQESQTPKKIEDMTIAEYLEYEKKVNENHINNTKSYPPTYLGKSTPTHDLIWEFSHYFDPNQPGTESDYDSEDMEEEVKYMTDDEVVMSEQEESNHWYT